MRGLRQSLHTSIITGIPNLMPLPLARYKINAHINVYLRKINDRKYPKTQRAGREDIRWNVRYCVFRYMS